MKVRDIYTIDCVELTEDVCYECPTTWTTFDNLDDAIGEAQTLAKILSESDGEEVYNIFVNCGEWEDEFGNIFGEQESVYCVSSANKERTMAMREECGYANYECDEYII